MTSNIDRAADVIYRTLNGKYGDFSHHEETADALANAGLLAPDLPEPIINADDEDDAILAAHAPEAVAEVVRLRKAIAELADEERATANDEFYPAHLRDLCRAYADDLTRILEGDTDE